MHQNSPETPKILSSDLDAKKPNFINSTESAEKSNKNLNISKTLNSKDNSEYVSNFKCIQRIDSHQRRRWGRREDCQLFINIRKLEKEGVLTLSEIVGIKSQLKAENHKGLIMLAERLDWKASNLNLVLRVKKFIHPVFSVRDIRLLKKLLMKSQYKNIDYEQILDNFPGKSMERIRTISKII